MVVTSPPWYPPFDDVAKTVDTLLQMKKPLDDGGLVFWHCNPEIADTVETAVQQDGWVIVRTILFNGEKVFVLRNNKDTSWDDKGFGDKWEIQPDYMGIWMCKGCLKFYGQKNVYGLFENDRFCSCGSSEFLNHTAVFPEEFVKRCMLIGSKEGDVILDSFAGSGTTGVVAMKINRRAILIDQNEVFCELAEHRLKRTEYELNLEKYGSWYEEQARKDRRYPFDIST